MIKLKIFHSFGKYFYFTPITPFQKKWFFSKKFLFFLFFQFFLQISFNHAKLRTLLKFYEKRTMIRWKNSKKPEKRFFGQSKKSGDFFHVFGRIFWLRRQISSSNSSKWSEKDCLSNDMSNYGFPKLKCVGQSFGTMEISRNRYFDLDIYFFQMFFDESYIHGC